MVCRFIDSFDYYAVGNLNRKYVDSNLGGVDQPRNGAGGANFTNVGQFLTKGFDDQATWIVGFAYQATSFNRSILVFEDTITSSTAQCTLRINLDGSMEVVRGTANIVAGGRSISILRADNWYYIEMKVTIANSISADSCVVRINEQIILTVDAGEDLQVSANATANTISITGTTSQFIDDLYIFDGTDGGSTEPTNDDFVGDVKVAIHLPDGNGATSDFTGSDGNSVDNYLLVDENPTDDDSTYTESSTPGEIDLYTFDNLATTPVDIFAVQVNNVIRKTEAGSRTMRTVVRPVSTNFFGTKIAPSFSSYINEEEIYNENPETGLAWTESEFNATEFGVEIET